MKLQREFPESVAQFLCETLGIVLILKSNDEIVCPPNDDNDPASI
jgi:hypothetical protein